MKIKELREEKKWTQQMLSQKTGLAQSTIHYIETKKKSPTERTLKKLAVAFDVEVGKLISK